MEGKPVPTVLLRYYRNGELSNGDLFLVYGEEYELIERFWNLEFKKMLTKFARALKDHPEAVGCITRLENGLLPYVLDAQSLALFREDPVAAIQSMMHVASPITAVKKESNVVPLEAAPIRAGFDTLAESFGDLVYTRARISAVECPGCGYWGATREALFRCEKKCAKLGFSSDLRVVLSRLWGGFRVEELLQTNLPRFFLPRVWNDGRSWITRNEFAEKYHAFQEEKEAACFLRTATR